MTENACRKEDISTFSRPLNVEGKQHKPPLQAKIPTLILNVYQRATSSSCVAGDHIGQLVWLGGMAFIGCTLLGNCE